MAHLYGVDGQESVTLGRRWRWWAIRAIALLSVVYLLGLMNVPTLIPYLIALIAVISDGFRTWRRGRQSS
jgi:hypothetical protein